MLRSIFHFSSAAVQLFLLLLRRAISHGTQFDSALRCGLLASLCNFHLPRPRVPFLITCQSKHAWNVGFHTPFQEPILNRERTRENYNAHKKAHTRFPPTPQHTLPDSLASVRIRWVWGAWSSGFGEACVHAHPWNSCSRVFSAGTWSISKIACPTLLLCCCCCCCLRIKTNTCRYPCLCFEYLRTCPSITSFARVLVGKRTGSIYICGAEQMISIGALRITLISKNYNTSLQDKGTNNQRRRQARFCIHVSDKYFIYRPHSAEAYIHTQI